MAVGLPPPPVNDQPGSFTWMEWYRQLRNYVSTSGSVPWYIINFAGSNITDIAARDHGNLQGLQGGTAGEHYHLTAAQHASLAAGLHNDLAGLQGGSSTERYHLSNTNSTAVINKEFPFFKVGDVAGGNYTDFDTTGFITFNGTTTVWDDLRVEPVVRTTGANAPTFTQWFTNGAGSRGVYLYTFPDDITSSEKEIFFSVQLPHSWKGTTIYPHVHWIPLAAGTAQRPVWGLEYNWADIGQTFGNTTIAYTTGLVPNDTNLVKYKHYISSFAGITPSTSQDEISAILMCRLFRYSGNASDTYTNSCGLLYVDFHYELDTLGSRTEFTK